jgi:hypothetical protein
LLGKGLPLSYTSVPDCLILRQVCTGSGARRERVLIVLFPNSSCHLERAAVFFVAIGDFWVLINANDAEKRALVFLCFVRDIV